MSSTQAQLTMHNSTKATPVGKVMLHVERGGFVIKSAVMPVLGKSSSVGMKLVQILDCDNNQSVNTQTLMPQNPPDALSDHILCQYCDVFNALGEIYNPS